MNVSYVLPLRWTDDRDLAELSHYLRSLASLVEVIVVDGSPATRFEKHSAEWGSEVVHIRPDPRYSFQNGKVNGVTTGVMAATHQAVVIADDDVRYTPQQLCRVAALLAHNDLVRPQNYFDPLPWHAAWDSARSLLNRSVGADYPGTLGVRKATFVSMGGYDGNVMFENLELIRTVKAFGGREVVPLDLYVRRLPPDPGHFLSQRVRQAYDDLTLPRRMLLWLAILPGLGLAVRKRAAGPVAVGIAASVGLAEVGRRRAGGARHFPFRTSLYAPAWLLERALCSWLALWQRATRGGVAYNGGVIRKAGNSPRKLGRKP
ncbi:MAG: glycosyltransferase [Actinomycetota bacterium]